MGDAYSVAASNAYINAINVFSKSPPSYSDCFKVAAYNGNNGGSVTKSLTLLEQKFKYEIKFEKQKDLDIERALLSISILVFTTSNEGWGKICNGELIRKPNGNSERWQATLVVGYNYQKDCYMCKGLWDSPMAAPCFNFKKCAAHEYYFITLYKE